MSRHNCISITVVVLWESNDSKAFTMIVHCSPLFFFVFSVTRCQRIDLQLNEVPFSPVPKNLQIRQQVRIGNSSAQGALHLSVHVEELLKLPEFQWLFSRKLD